MNGKDARREHGFTLIELLVAITIEALVVGALGMAFVGILNGTTNVNQSFDRSGDARIAANYIVSDARNSSGPEVSLSDTTSCGSGTGATAVARFNWTSTGSAGTTTANIVDYVLVGNSLMRRQCTNGSLVSNTAVASSVASVVVACSPTANCSGTPKSITASVTEVADSNGAVYQYSLTGAFRKLNGTGPPVPPQSVVLLGANGPCSGTPTVSLSTSASVQVYGTTSINTTDVGACTAMLVTTSASFKAAGTAILAGGSCAANTSGVCPATTSYPTPIADPYAGLSAPSAVALGLTAQAGCPGGHAVPGVYAATLSISVSNSCQLGSGVYILNNGLSVSTSASLTSAPGGVLLYILGGSFQSSTSATVNIAAQSSGSWKGVAIWEPSANTNTISFTTSGSTTLGGFIYAPNAAVNMSTSAANPTVTGIVAKSLIMSTSGTLSIGAPSAIPLSITAPATLPAWTVNRPYPTTTLSADGGDGNYTWSATSPPAGLSFDTSTATLSGTPTGAGGSFTVTLNDGLGDNPAPKTYTVTINAAPTITTTSPLPNAKQSIAYNTTVVGSAGTAPYTWSATGLSAGLSIDPTSGVISGTPTTNGTSTVAVTLTDSAGATVSKNLSLTVTPTISSVVLANGSGTPGTIDQGDTITVVYSAPMKVSSLCSGAGAWSNDANNQTVNGDNVVTVTVTNSGGGDTVTVTTGSGCTFNFGSINLSSTAYVTATATFKGAGAAKSTIAWTAGTKTLVITLGAKTGGTVANVPGNTSPIYTVNAGIQDSLGNAVGNSPFTLTPAARRF